MLSGECFDVGCFNDATDDEGDQGIDISKAEKLSPVPNINQSKIRLANSNSNPVFSVIPL